jgi:hypothetical protein
MLVVIEIVAALETGRAEGRGILYCIVKRNPLVPDAIAGTHYRAIKPPFITTKQHVRFRDRADAARRRTMAIIHRHRKALWRDQPSMAALHAVHRIIMQPVGIVHCLHPAADIVVGERIDHPRGLHCLADIIVEVRTIEFGCGHQSPYLQRIWFYSFCRNRSGRRIKPRRR